MKIYLATWIDEVAQDKSLSLCKKRERLLSYHFIKNAKNTLKEYIKRSFS
ncbi:MAG: hypothetical protein BWY23_02635 [Spirochaetes bacterium ADurb.Bin218]|nr:MAG: hypothetical protein BWY23_02635 [Spirochaetes bacterium ADurb.Bin218]